MHDSFSLGIGIVRLKIPSLAGEKSGMVLWIEELLEQGSADKAKRNQTIKVKIPTCKKKL
jgi:hypothetical protein